MTNFLLIPFLLKIVSARAIKEATDFDLQIDSVRTITSNETSTVIFLTSDPIIDIIDSAVNEEVIEQLQLGFETYFVKNILSSLDGEMIDLDIDRIMIIGVLNASNITIGYYSAKGSTDYSDR